MYEDLLKNPNRSIKKIMVVAAHPHSLDVPWKLPAVMD
jgi:hypothetical protein